MNFTKFTIIISLFGLFSSNLFGQSKVILSNLLVTNNFTNEPEIKQLGIIFNVTEIENLNSIQFEASETSDFKDNFVVSLGINHKDGKHFIDYGLNKLLPISGKPKVIFFLDVRDQFKMPYHFFRISCMDNVGQKTNQIFFNRN